MFNFKLGGIAAGTAFLLSFLIGLVSGAVMPMLLVKPLVFAVLFFVISSLVKVLVARFLPELAEENFEADDPFFNPGSRVNIMEGDSRDAEGYQALRDNAAMGARPDTSDDAVGDISDLSSTAGFSLPPAEKIPAGMDQNPGDGYTGTGGAGDFSVPGMENFFDLGVSSGAAQAERPPENKAPPAGVSEGRQDGARPFFGSDDILPDLDSMAGAFVSNSSREEPDTTEYSVSPPPKKRSSNKGQEWAGDFNAKDIAAGLRTVLNKDKEG